MIRFLLALAFFFTINFLPAQQGPIWNWQSNLGGDRSDKALDLAVASDGSVYTCGYFNRYSYFDSIVLGVVAAQGGTKEIFLAKQDEFGNYLWARMAAGGADDRALGLCVDKDDNIIVTGTYWNYLFIDTFTCPGQADHCFVAKYDPQGNLLWAIGGGGEGDDHGYDVVTDANGTIYVTGFLTNHWAPPVCTGVFGSLPAFTYTDSIAFVASISADGEWQWVRTFDGCDGERDNDIAVDNQGGVYVAGGFYGANRDFGPVQLSSNANSRDIFVMKYDTSGNFQWVKQVGGYNDDRANGVTIGADNMLYVTGEFRAEVHFDGDTLNNNGGPAGRDIFVAKMDGNGNWKWASKAGSNEGGEAGRGITATNNHCIFVTGQAQGQHVWFGDSIFFDTGADSIQMFVAGIDTAGHWRWALQAGGPFEDRGCGIDADEECRVYVSGYFDAPVADFGFFTDSSYGDKDGFAVRLDVTCFDYVSDTLSGIDPASMLGCIPEINTVLAPNADPGYDVIRIRNSACFGEGRWTIYNLWGQIVFETNALSEPWRGTDMNGNVLPAGTYYYRLVSTGNKSASFTGQLMIIRF